MMSACLLTPPTNHLKSEVNLKFIETIGTSLDGNKEQNIQLVNQKEHGDIALAIQRSICEMQVKITLKRGLNAPNTTVYLEE